MNYTLTPSQIAAVADVRSLLDVGKKVISLAGAAGTGKTTLIEALLVEHPDAVVCTPTNKAAQVLCDKGIPAATFYKTFYTLEEKRSRVAGNPPRFFTNRSICEKRAYATGGHWADHVSALADGKLAHARVLIIDEASMLTSRRVRELEDMCDHLILVGDPHQLPPVGDRDCPAGFFAGLQFDVELTEVMRQAEGSLILRLATAIRDEDMTMAERGFRHFKPHDTFADWVRRGAKTIVFTNRERIRINTVARGILKRIAPVPVPGDLVVSVSNYSDDIINGTELVVRQFEWDGCSPSALITVCSGVSTVTCNMDMHAFFKDQPERIQNEAAECLLPHPRGTDTDEFAQLVFSYAVTAHKAQGSEWDDVVMIDQRGLVKLIAEKDNRPGLPSEEQARRWAYTVVTRARRCLAVVSAGWAK